MLLPHMMFAPYPWIVLGILVLALAEVSFWSDDKKPEKKQSKFWFTVNRKIIHIVEASGVSVLGLGAGWLIFCGGPRFISGVVSTIANLVDGIIDFATQYGGPILNFVCVGTATVLIVYVYIKFNSLKYRRKK